MKTSAPHFPRRGFTLIESLATILILSLIIALATPSMLGAIRASRLTSAGELLTGKLAEAQGLALTFSSDVELRFYKGPATPPADGDSGQFLQLLQWVENDPDSGEEGIASLKKIGARMPLPAGVAISSHPEFTSLWNLENRAEETTEGLREYIAIRFRPDGSTDLPEAGAWHLTLVEDEKSTELPANFYTIQIDPATSKLEIYRPE